MIMRQQKNKQTKKTTTLLCLMLMFGNKVISSGTIFQCLRLQHMHRHLNVTKCLTEADMEGLQSGQPQI